MGSMCKNVHISDSGYGEFKHEKLGTGIVEVAPVAAALREIGYEGFTILEIIADAMDPANDPDGDIKASAAILAGAGFAPLSA